MEHVERNTTELSLITATESDELNETCSEAAENRQLLAQIEHL